MQNRTSGHHVWSSRAGSFPPHSYPLSLLPKVTIPSHPFWLFPLETTEHIQYNTVANTVGCFHGMWLVWFWRRFSPSSWGEWWWAWSHTAAHHLHSDWLSRAKETGREVSQGFRKMCFIDKKRCRLGGTSLSLCWTSGMPRSGCSVKAVTS